MHCKYNKQATSTAKIKLVTLQMPFENQSAQALNQSGYLKKRLAAS